MNRGCGVSGKDVRDPQTYAIIGAAMDVHRNLGSEFLEPAYQAALEVEFGIRDVPHDREVDMPIHYKGVPLGVRYRADFVCFGAILVELKAMDRISTREEAQIINYLAASGIGRGILLNFGTASLQFKRFVGSAYLTLSNASSVKSVGPRS